MTDDSKISLVKCLQGRSSQVVYDNSEKAQNAEIFKCQLLALRFYSIVASEYAHGSRLFKSIMGLENTPADCLAPIKGSKLNKGEKFRFNLLLELY